MGAGGGGGAAKKKRIQIFYVLEGICHPNVNMACSLLSNTGDLTQTLVTRLTAFFKQLSTCTRRPESDTNTEDESESRVTRDNTAEMPLPNQTSSPSKTKEGASPALRRRPRGPGRAQTPTPTGLAWALPARPHTCLTDYRPAHPSFQQHKRSTGLGSGRSKAGGERGGTPRKGFFYTGKRYSHVLHNTLRPQMPFSKGH